MKMKRRVNIYKNMMSGISQLLPFIVAGGVFISLSFLFNSYQSNSEIALWFNDTGKLIISFSLPVLAAFIAYAIADRPGLVPGFIAGALALAGGSGFLGALIGGFASGYIALIIIKIFSRLPRSVHGFNAILFFPVLGALFAALFMIGVNLVIEPATTTLITFINGLNVVGVIITGLVAASLMAFDLGGPVNKVTYMLGIATIINGDQSILMAAIMAGGMIPPLGVALATLIFKNKFNEKQRNLGKKNWLMGLLFITEGALSYAKESPKIFIPIVMVGSALAGGLVGLFQTSIAIPHGGILVLVFMQNWWGFIIALISGMLFTALSLGLFLPSKIE